MTPGIDFDMGIGDDALSAAAAASEDALLVDGFLDVSSGGIFPWALAAFPHSSADTILPLTGEVKSSSEQGSFDFCIPCQEEAAELEWLSLFVEERIASGSVARSKRPRLGNIASDVLSSLSTTSSPPASSSSSEDLPPSKPNWTLAENGGRGTEGKEAGRRRCTHCSSEMTPQWRVGPLGPKTLCNACGVRYKSGRLVPEYRPAASPTFELSRHSNSHRKVMELRRQKELLLRH